MAVSMEEILVIAVCLVLNGFFAAYEMAFVSVGKPELRRLARGGDRAAQVILELRQSPERTLSILQIGITLVGAISAAVGGAGASESIDPLLRVKFGLSENASEFLSILLVVLPLTFLSVVVGELVPKSLALKNPLRIVLRGARMISMADRFLSPAVSSLEWSTKSLLKVLFPFSPGAPQAPEASIEIDTLSQHHQQAVLNLAHIERKKVRDILLPWREVVSVRCTDTMEDVVPVILTSGHTRLPVVRDSLVEGMLHTKEFLTYREAGNRDWQAIIRPSLHVSPQDSILSTLRMMQAKRNHMAIVSAASGEPLGIVTLEDISEEIWGEIYDEDDDSRIRRIFADRVKHKIKPPRR